MKQKTRILLVLSPLLIVLCLAHPAQAQSSSCFGYLQFCALCGDIPVPGMQCQPEAPFLSQCKVMLNNCAPPKAHHETRCPYCDHAGSPINLTDGNTFIIQNDFTLPGLGGGLSLARTWNSTWPLTQTAFKVGLFGPNWRSTYEERVFLGSDNYMKYSRSDGSFWSFGYNFNTKAMQVAAPGEESVSMVSSGAIWTMTFKNGGPSIANVDEWKSASIP